MCRLMKLLNFPDEIRSKKSVAIKMNLCGLRGPETGAVTHPAFLDAFLGEIRDRCGNAVEVAVVESDATVSLPGLFLKWFGFAEILEKWGAKFVNLTTGPKGEAIREGPLRGQRIPKILEESYLISLAKLKTHSLTKISCALKNQFGCIPHPRKTRYHKHLDEVIVEANRYFKPDLSVVDGIIAMRGRDGPSHGVPFHANVVLGSVDPVACDSACAKLLGFRPRGVRHLQLAEKAGLGSKRYAEIGPRIQLGLHSEREFLESSILARAKRILNGS